MSSASATFTATNFSLAPPPAKIGVGVFTTLKKKWEDATFTLSFGDAFLKDPAGLQGVVVAVDKPLGNGVKAAVAFDAAKRSATGMVTLSKPINGSDLQLRAIYKQAGDVFILEETWMFDANNKLSGAYNLSSDELTCAYTHTRGPWSSTTRYNVQKDSSVLEVQRKRGKATLGAAYAVQDKLATLSWSAKPFRAQLKAKVDGSGIKATAASLTVTHEFEL